ncbi:MAG: hypothetical protein L3J21_09815 [Devosiaceae bacterium]|nr:hypothetical protein [Devosiaceae bacterium]
MSGIVLAIDPGTTKSAYVVYDDGNIREKGILDNHVLVEKLREGFSDHIINDLAMEMVACYGMPVGATVFETCVWIGRFIEAWGREYEMVYRKSVKIYLCGATKAKDGNVRQAIMDRYGSTREAAIGKKDSPGPLYGVSKDIWAAIGVAITFSEK